MTTSVIEASALCRIFMPEDGRGPVHAVDGAAFAVPSQARLVALVGPDGAGKTTLMQMLCGLEGPTSGTLSVLGRTPDPEDEDFVNAVGYMPQALGLYKDLSVMENMRLFGALRGTEPPEGMSIEDCYAHLIALTGLAGFEDRPAGKLSGGMKQKLALAVALVRAPELLLLDEPTVGVDPLSRRELWGVIRRMIQEGGTTCFFSTAYLEEAEASDLVLCMSEGRIIGSGSPAELLDRAKGRTFAIDLAGISDAAGQQLARRMMLRASPDSGESPFLDVVPRDGGINVLLNAAVDRERAEREVRAALDGKMPSGLSVAERPPRMEDAYAILTFSKAGAEAISPGFGESPAAGHESRIEAGNVPIRVKELSRTFGSFTAVADTTFDVMRGEIFGLLGPNGAGKTTTFRMMCGLLAPSGGGIEVLGWDLRRAKAEVRAEIGYVAQKFSLYDKLTVEENLRYFGRSYGFWGRSLTRRVEEVLTEFGLADYRGTPAKSLPAGARRDLSIACALLHHPKILFLDEATSGADLASRRTFWRSLAKLAASGTTIVVTTHFMEEAEYCDRFLIQDAGRILAIGSPGEVRADASKASPGRTIRSIEDAFIAIVEASRAGRMMEAGS